MAPPSPTTQTSRGVKVWGEPSEPAEAEAGQASSDAGGSADSRLWFLCDLDALRRRLVLAEVLGVPVSRRLPAACRRSRRWGQR